MASSAAGSGGAAAAASATDAMVGDAAAAAKDEKLNEQLRRIAVENYDWETRAVQMLVAYRELQTGEGEPPIASGITPHRVVTAVVNKIITSIIFGVPRGTS